MMSLQISIITFETSLAFYDFLSRRGHTATSSPVSCTIRETSLELLILAGSPPIILMLKDPGMLWLLALSARSLTLASYTNKTIGFKTAILNNLEPGLENRLNTMNVNPTVTQTRGTSLPPELLLIGTGVRGETSLYL